jgi:LuxR family transcriptional regulator, maltose regulon positive regulatory protein
LIALAATVAATGDRGRAAELFGEAEEIVAACRDAGVLPARLAAAKRAARIVRPTAGDELSERELTVLRYLRGGRSESEIARELYLSFNTVHSHVKAIYRKLGVSSRAEALARASAEGLL